MGDTIQLTTTDFFLKRSCLFHFNCPRAAISGSEDTVQAAGGMNGSLSTGKPTQEKREEQADRPRRLLGHAAPACPCLLTTLRMAVPKACQDGCPQSTGPHRQPCHSSGVDSVLHCKWPVELGGRAGATGVLLPAWPTRVPTSDRAMRGLSPGVTVTWL